MQNKSIYFPTKVSVFGLKLFFFVRSKNFIMVRNSNITIVPEALGHWNNVLYLEQASCGCQFAIWLVRNGFTAALKCKIIGKKLRYHSQWLSKQNRIMSCNECLRTLWLLVKLNYEYGLGGDCCNCQASQVSFCVFERLQVLHWV